MNESIIYYKSFDIAKLDDFISFSEVNGMNDRHQDIEPEIKFLMLEIKSTEPPTDCTLKIMFTEKGDTTIKNQEILLMKYRIKFIYENGLYILDLQLVDELKEGIVPFKIKFNNERDKTSTVKILYSLTFPEKPRFPPK